MYGNEQTRGIRHRVSCEVIGKPVTEEEWTRNFSVDVIEEARKLTVFGGPVLGSRNIVVRWNADADPLDVAAFLAASVISEHPRDVLDVLLHAFGETKEVI